VNLNKRDMGSAEDRPFAQYRGTLEVPALADSTDQPLDLGTLTLDVYGVGAAAPLFECETADGKSLRLIDYRGKFVLLHIWMDSFLDNLDCLQELQKTYGDRGDLQIIGINWGEPAKQVATYAAEHKMVWPQIPYPESEAILGQYRAPYRPYVMLIDREGKIVLVDSPNEGELTKLVREAIEHAPAPTPGSPSGVSGRVVDPNGWPVAGVQVVFDTEGVAVRIYNGAIDTEKKCLAETDAEGRFSLSGQGFHEFALVAVHEAGFARVAGEEFQKNHEIRLEKWGRLEGQLAKAHAGTENAVVMVGSPGSTQVCSDHDIRYVIQCGPEGRFVFERVLPGWFNVGYQIQTGDGFCDCTSRTSVVIKAGETAKVKVGGEGRPVIGRFVPPASYGRPVYFGAGLRQMRTHWPDLPPSPDGHTTQRDADEWFDGGPEPREWAHRVTIQGDLMWRSYAFRISPDGSFRIEDVIPGQYDLRVHFLEGNIASGPFAGYRGTIDVPVTTRTPTDQPFDLGTLTLDMRGLGEMAPLFEAKALDGKPIRLIDYRDKFVLLSFWTPGLYHDLNRLKELHKMYGARGDFHIIGFGAWNTLGAVSEYVAEHQIEWPEIYLGEPLDKGIARSYHWIGLPYIVLVDPQGKISAVWLEEEKLTNAVREALESHPAPAPATAPIRTRSGRAVDPNVDSGDSMRDPL
jgi:peroxiredoxin